MAGAPVGEISEASILGSSCMDASDVSPDSTVITAMEHEYIDYDPVLPGSLPTMSGSPVLPLTTPSDPQVETQVDATRGLMEQESEHTSSITSSNDSSIAHSLVEEDNPIQPPLRHDYVPLPPWLSQRLQNVARLRALSSLQPVPAPLIISQLNAAPSPDAQLAWIQQAPTPHQFLQQHFPHFSVELNMLHSSEIKALSGYANYQDKVVTMHNGMTLTLANVYSWMDLNPGTFSNKRPRLYQLHTIFQELQELVDSGLAIPDLQASYRLWYPYQLSAIQLSNRNSQTWPVSVHYSMVDMFQAIPVLRTKIDAAKSSSIM
ncbi:hypothetical protein BDP27DRAFT_1424110 [Rhodocollybia butyracea]|uniref:Uncharacterized protein n=1 Tax=Rhodocollybia butyracea TaxID=206335 RepID=A0A9P5PPJ3_9AGAR|nr:hypothetical protein BDP27DRAFT_1424110 [Rhodocollybia butyracea]